MYTTNSSSHKAVEIEADGTLSNSSDSANSPGSLRLLTLTLDATLCATFTDEHWEAFDETVASFPAMGEVRFRFDMATHLAEHRAAGFEAKMVRLRAAGKLRLGIDIWPDGPEEFWEPPVWKSL